MTMLATYHVVCAFPGCGHTAVMKQPFDWPLAPAPEPELPHGWSVVIRRGGDSLTMFAVCAEHDFAFDGVKTAELRPVGFTAAKEEPTE